MASRYFNVSYREFPKGKWSPPARGDKPSTGAVSERTTKWGCPGPTKGSSFNRATKVPVVKTRPAKAGVD